ncbi:hypothetical protein CARUB_v10003202mg, partial [Capsella rubella]
MRRRHRKKAKTVNKINNVQTSELERTNLVELPHDLVMEINGRLPLKSVARFLTVSKLWETTVRSPDFITSYPRGSSGQPRTLIAADLNSNRCHSSRSRVNGDLHLSCISRLTIPVTYHHYMKCFYHHVNGLISVGYGQDQILFNPVTGKSIPLPRPKTRRKLVKSFFGYDSVSDQYKVLCMTIKMHGLHEEPSSEHQVLTLTLGAKMKPWDMIKCSVPHRPSSNGVCINGVVYYVARTGAGMSHMRLMRFALRPGNMLDLFASLPEETQTTGILFLMNYEGKLAIPSQPTSYTYDVWVLNQLEGANHEWLKKITFSIEPWKTKWNGSCGFVYVRGITHKGEFILAPEYYTNEFYVFHYNPDKNSFRKIVIPVSAGYK